MVFLSDQEDLVRKEKGLIMKPLDGTRILWRGPIPVDKAYKDVVIEEQKQIVERR